MKKLLLFALTAALFASCGQSNKQKEGEEAQESVATNEAAQAELGNDGHNAQNSLDWFGTYEGLTPCADCEGIKVKVTLNEDQTFAIHNVYIKNGKEESPTDYTGKFVWDESGSIITLEGAKDVPTKFFVAEGRIIILDQEGKRIEGALADNYVLNKVG